MNQEAVIKIEQASARMLLRYPWWASLYLCLRRREEPSVPTMATDGTYLLYNPEFTNKLSIDECLAVLMHETAHCALLHPYRLKDRDPFLWNIACDGAVNAVLMADGLVLPEGCVPPESLELTAEEIYDKLKKSVKKIKIKVNMDVLSPGSGSQPGDKQDGNHPGEVQVGPNGDITSNIPARSEQDWKDTLSQARGTQPTGLNRTVEQVMEPTIPWKDVLVRFLTNSKKAAYHTWNRPSRRRSELPGWKREPSGKVAICVDTSGSIDAATLDSFLGEIRAISALDGTEVWIISCDAAVGECYELEPSHPMPTSFRGGGGTDFRPAITRAEELTPDAIVYLTDGEGSFPENSIVPTLWALTNRRVSPPFGESLHIER